ncbi:MAG: hypothetical protein ACOXZK_00040 [Bacteroidales bacterium]|jgi:hypothetical protein|nr:hypothetical protein [Bacteroidales bacterium]
MYLISDVNKNSINFYLLAKYRKNSLSFSEFEKIDEFLAHKELNLNNNVESKSIR